MRRICYEIHLYLGIISGLIVFIVCLSGVLYAFRSEVELFLEPHKFHVLKIHIQAEHSRIPVQQLIADFEKSGEWRVQSVFMPEGASRSFEIYATKPKAGKRPSVFYVNPYTGETLGTGGSPADGFFRNMMFLHRFLLLPQHIGRPIVGSATLIFVVLLLTGVILWMPRAFRKLSAWKPGFLVNFKSGGSKMLYDLHNTLGFYAMIPLLFLALTGLCWSFNWYRNAASFVLQEPVFSARFRKPMQIEPNGERLSITEILAKQNEIRSDGNTTISFPQSPKDTIVISKQRTGFLAVAASDRYEWNAYSGVLEKKELFSEKHFGAKLSYLVKAIHLGDVYGMPSKILFFIATLIAMTLPITGIWLWVNKLRRFSRSSKAAG